MRRRILLLVVGMTVLVVLAFAVPLAILIRTTTYNNAVTGLGHDATDIALVVLGHRTTPTTSAIRKELAKFDDVDASVQLPGGRVIGTTPPGTLDDLPAIRSVTGAGSSTQPSAVPSGFGNPFGGGAGPNGSPQGSDPGPYAGGQLVQLERPTFNRTGSAYTVRVYAGNGTLRSGERGYWALLAGASVVLVLIGIALGEWLTRRIVRPLLNTADTAGRLAAGDVTARATTSGPGEIAEVGLALNRLADRIDQLIAEERETVADLSHRAAHPAHGTAAGRRGAAGRDRRPNASVRTSARWSACSPR